MVLLLRPAPGLPERRARRWHWRFFKRFLRDANPKYTAEEIDRYVDAWSQPGAAKAMIDYYRAAMRLSSKQADLKPISAPTLVIWGEGDRVVRRLPAVPRPPRRRRQLMPRRRSLTRRCAPAA